jgi:5-methylcytosine-specific restriction endonuclease McrA
MSESLRSLPDKDILSRTKALSVQERATTLLLLAHLNEVERRQLHLKLGHSSMFDYCTAGLGYSSSAAYRRIQTARCIARYPGLNEMLQRNEVNLSTVAQASRILNENNHRELLSRICGKSQREVESILADYRPTEMPRDRVRTVTVPADVTSGQLSDREPALFFSASSVSEPQLSGADDPCEKDVYCRSGSEPAKERTSGAPATEAQTREVPATETRTSIVPATEWSDHAEKRVVLQFSAHPEFMVKLERVRALAWHRLPAGASFEQVIDLALDLFIERNDPVARHERRVARHGHSERRGSAGTLLSGGRHIPAATRDEIFARDDQRCAYVSGAGRRCESKQALQIDHIRPVARGGPSTAGNLRLLCAYHNRLEAERLGLGKARRVREVSASP